MIVRDVLYLLLAYLLLQPSNPLKMILVFRILMAVFLIGVRVWQHVNYYKKTGKIY